MKMKVFLILCVVGLTIAMNTQERGLDINCYFDFTMYVKEEYWITVEIINYSYLNYNITANNLYVNVTFSEKLLCLPCGEGDDSIGYFNPSLREGKKYEIKVKTISTGTAYILVICNADNFQMNTETFSINIIHKPPTTPEFPLISSFTAIFAIFGILALVLWRRR